MTTSFYRRFEAASQKEDILEGVIVCEQGEAKGHGVFISREFLNQVVTQAKGHVIKVRLDHPEEGKPGRLLSLIGEAFNFRLDDNKVRCDIKLFDVPAKETVKTLARQAGHLFGMSLDFIMKRGRKLANGLYEAVCEAINAVDFVETPAATTSLFNQPVDSMTHSMNIAIPRKMIEALGLAEDKADEKAVLAALENALAKAAKYDEAESAPKDEESESSEKKKKEGEPIVDEEDKEAEEEKKACRPKMAEGEEKKKDEEEEDEEFDGELSARQEKAVRRLAAKEITRLLAHVGLKPTKFGMPQEAQPPKPAEPTLTPEEAAIATKLGLDPKVYAKNLMALKGPSTKL